MTVLTLTTEPSDELGAALERFERQFLYPLGPNRSFRVSHGRRYLPFFQAMGEARLLVVLCGDEVHGTLVIVTRRLARRPNNPSADWSASPAIPLRRETPVHYLCDLKVHPEARSGPALASLFRRAGEIVRSSGSTACYAVVMQGTGRLPVEYTGRLGIPRFEQTGRIAILRLTPRPGGSVPATDCREVAADELSVAYERLAPPGLSLKGHDSHIRSVMIPVGLIDRSDAACGLLEDTLLGKRLFTDGDEELRSAHLSCFAWSDPQAAARLLETAARAASVRGYPALFVALPEPRLAEMLPHLRDTDVLVAPAQVFSHDIAPGDLSWWIDTAEI